jgi:hypothetical protein
MDRPPNRLFLGFVWREGQQPFVDHPLAGEQAIGGEVNGGGPHDDAVASVVSNDEVEEEPEYPFDLWTADLYGPNGDDPTPEYYLLEWQEQGRLLRSMLNGDLQVGTEHLHLRIWRYAQAEVDFALVGGTFPDEDSRRSFYDLFDAEELEILIAERVRYGGPDFEPDEIGALNAERIARH